MRSIGSLGDDNSKAYVSGINVDGAKLSETDNGVRIKTYQVIGLLFVFYCFFTNVISWMEQLLLEIVNI